MVELNEYMFCVFFVVWLWGLFTKFSILKYEYDIVGMILIKFLFRCLFLKWSQFGSPFKSFMPYLSFFIAVYFSFKNICITKNGFDFVMYVVY